MKLPRRTTCQRCTQGFSLVETVMSIGVMSFGFLSLAPLLAIGLTHAKEARQNRTTARIATTMIEEAKQGTFTGGTAYFDTAGNLCSDATGAAYETQGTLLGTAPLTRVTLRIAPIDAPTSARIYAEVFPTPP